MVSEIEIVEKIVELAIKTAKKYPKQSAEVAWKTFLVSPFGGSIGVYMMSLKYGTRKQKIQYYKYKNQFKHVFTKTIKRI